jgi:nucleoside-diphosphate-sugar epimerase
VKVFITGAGGFLGGHLARELIKQGHQVTSLARGDYPKLRELGINCIKGDIQNQDLLRKAMKDHDACFHVASKVGMWGRREDFYQTNVKGTENIIEACKQNNIEILIYTSTPSVVFGDSDIENADETIDYPDRYYSFYAETKSQAEQLVLKENSDRLKTVALRPHLIFGQGDQNLIPRVVDAAKKGKLKIIGDGENKVDITFVSNAVSAHLKALENLQTSKTAAGQAYFIGQGPVKLWDFINKILSLYNIPAIEKKISFKNAYRIGAIIDTLLKITRKYDSNPPMTRFIALQMAKNHFFNHNKAERDLNWSPSISIDEGIELLRSDV